MIAAGGTGTVHGYGYSYPVTVAKADHQRLTVTTVLGDTVEFFPVRTKRGDITWNSVEGDRLILNEGRA